MSSPALAADESPITYEQLSDLEQEFEDVETEIIRHQVQLTAPLYAKRHALVSQIPNFWPLVFEQAPSDIDEYIQPSDATLLLSSLTSLSVRHFEIESSEATSTSTSRGEPRSIAITFEFAENDHFADRVLEKKFWHRRARDGWTGLVSEPVAIQWKSRKQDLTDGLLGAVCDVWRLEKEHHETTSSTIKTKTQKDEPEELRNAKKALRKRIQDTPLGGLSFFAWFGYRGRSVSAEEHVLATEAERRRRAGEEIKGDDKDDEVEDDSDDNDDDDEYEIFPTGDELAIAISEDLWPGALKYFAQAQEQDVASDVDFESDDDDDDEDDHRDHDDEVDELEDARPSKRHKA